MPITPEQRRRRAVGYRYSRARRALGLCAAAAFGWMTLMAGCSLGPTSDKPVALADDWELVGPFKALSRQKSRKSKSGRGESQPDPTFSPTSRPSHLEDLPVPTHFDDSFNLDRIPPGLFAGVPHEDDTFWYIDVGYRTGYTRLESAADKLELRMDLPLKLDVLGVFASPTTPLDRKTDMLLTTQYIGLGRRETDWLTWNFYVGGAAGKDKTHQRWMNANLDVEFDYALIYTGLTADMYPWGIPKYRNYANYRERLKASRPYAVTGLEVGYLRAGGKGGFRLAPVPIYRDSQKIEDWLVSWLLGLGWEFPLNDRWAFNFSGHYTFHFYRPEEYDGYNLVFAFRYRF